MSILIILRGNSGSGKTATAKELHRRLPPGTALLISQDVIRREMLNVKDRPQNPAIDLIKLNAAFGRAHCDVVIIEGILKRELYNAALLKIAAAFDQTVACYFDIPYEETLRRHQSRPQAQEFGAASLKKWWLEKDYLALPGEIQFTTDDTLSMRVEQLLKIIQKAEK